MPAYVDDILYHLMSSRVGYDGWQTLNPYPQCSPNPAVDIPFTLLPGRVVSWATDVAFSGSAFSLRLIPIVVLITGLTYGAWFLNGYVLRVHRVLYVFAGLVGFISLGTMPLTMTSNHPEADIFFAMVFFASLPFLICNHPEPSRWAIAGVTSLFVLMSSVFLSVHPKALFYTPLVLLSAAYVCKWHRLVGGALVALVVTACYQSCAFWEARLSCPDSIEVREFMAAQALSPATALKEPWLFLKDVVRNIVGAPAYLQSVLFPVKQWQLPHLNSMSAFSLVANGCASLWVLAVILHYVWWTYRSVILMSRDALAKREWKEPLLLVPVCLLISALAQCGIQSDKRPYNFALIWLTLGICGAVTAGYLLKHTNYWEDKHQRVKIKYGQLSLVAVFSQWILLATCIPGTVFVLKHLSSNGTMEMDREWYLISPLDDAKRQTHIWAAGKVCNIAPNQSSHRVGVDIVTYWTLRKTYQPLRLVFKYHDYDEPRELYAFLRQRNSSGLVTLCSSLPPKVRPLASETEGVCCLSREQIATPLP